MVELALDVVGFPKLTPTPVHRTGVEAWLRFHEDVPLRWIAGPAGCGKTTAAQLYARGCAQRVCYIRLHTGSTLTTFVEALERVLNTSIDPARIVEGFPTDARTELVVDEIDNADEHVRRVLEALPNRVPSNVTLLYLSRSRRVIDLVSLVTQGLAVVMDPPLLAFTQAETTELCDALGVSYTSADVGELIHATDGWAFALSGTLRDAAYESSGLRGAFGHWHERHARLIGHLIERSLVGLNPEEREAAEQIYAGEEPGTTPAFAHLHDCGLLISFSDSELRPLRGIFSVASRPAHKPAPAALPVAVIQMFGEFSMEIDGRRVEWCRRRDRQLIAFIALQPEAAAARSLVLGTFWPDAEPHLAAQSLRTACSTIRRAIAQCVGYDRVEHYFTAGRDLRLNTNFVSITSHRLRAHIHAAEEAYGNGDVIVARGHYLAACRIYKARLLDGDGNESWLAGPAEMFAAMVAGATDRTLDIRRQRTDESGVTLAPPRLSFST